MEKLPSKYKHLRLNLSKGAKQAGTKEIFAEHQQAEPNAVDGVLRIPSARPSTCVFHALALLLPMRHSRTSP